MKKTLAAVLLFVIIVTVGPFVTGPIAKRGIEAQISRINQLPGYFAVLEEYRQGWWGASAIAQVGAVKGEAATTGNFRLNMKITHGPIFIAGGIGTGLMRVSGLLDVENVPKAKALQQKAGIHSFLFYETVTNLLGNTTIQANSPAFTLTDNSSPYANVTFGGMSLHGRHLLGENTTSIQIAMPASSIDGQTARVVIEPVVVNGDVVINDSRVHLNGIHLQWDGFAEYRHDRSASDPDIKADNISLSLRTEQDSNNTIKMQMDYAAEHLIAETNKIEDLQLKLEFERFGIVEFDRYQQFFQSFSDRENHTGGLAHNIQQILVGLGRSFLKNSPVLTIPDFRFYYNGILCNATLRANIDGANLEEAGINDPTVLLRRLTINAKVDASEDLAREIARRYLGKQWLKTRMANYVSPQVIKNMAARQSGTFLEVQLQKGNLLRTENGYQAVLLMRDGELFLNGQSVPVI